MNAKNRAVLIGAVLAAGIAAASAFYLKKTKTAVERVFTPVEFSAPDLYPESTLLYSELHGLDKSYGRAAAWWKKFETTAAHLALRRMWDKNREAFPTELVDGIGRIDAELEKTQQKFGYRPTAADFFETYGRHLAIGVLPAGKDAHPNFLMATRLPEGGATAFLQGHLAKAKDIKPCEPPLHRGFPMFIETVGGDIGALYYGVGRGYLLISDAAVPMQQSLDRLATATDEKEPKRPTGTLGGDPALGKVSKNASFVFYVKRDQKFADWKPELAPVDEYVKNAFVLAPQDASAAFSVDETTREVRCSFTGPAPRPWFKTLPEGMLQVQAALPVSADELARLRTAQTDWFFGKPLWKEIDAFLKDPVRVKTLIREAVPARAAPDADILALIPNDVRVLGDLLRSGIESLLSSSPAEFVSGSKAYGSVQSVIGFDLDPFAVFTLSGGLDLAATKFPDWLKREDKPGILTWTLNTDRVLDEITAHMPPESIDIVEGALKDIRLSILVTGNRVMFVTGKDLLGEITALLTGAGRSMDDDALFKEARDQVKPGFATINYWRPAELIKSSFGPIRKFVEKMVKQNSAPDDTKGLEVMGAAFDTFDKVLGWGMQVRAEITVGYTDPARSSETVQLIDPEKEKAGPQVQPPDAAPRTPMFLPKSTWLLEMHQLEFKTGMDAIRKEFIAALPGGEERFKEMFPPADPDNQKLIDALVDGLIRNLKGESGLAIAVPRLDPEAAKTPGLPGFVARAPAFVGFAQFEKPDVAFESLGTLLSWLNQAVNPEPFQDRHRQHLESGGPAPFGSEMTFGEVGTCPAIAIDIFIPLGGRAEYLNLPLCFLQRDGRIFATTSTTVLKFIGIVKEGSEDTMSGGAEKAIPAGSIPPKVSALRIFRGDSLVDQIHLLLEPVVPGAIGLSLQGYETKPPDDRIEAHTKGWERFTELTLDLFRTSTWNIGATSRTGNIIRRVQIQVAERK